MLGLLGVIFGGSVLFKGAAKEAIQFDADRNIAKKNNMKVFYSKNKKGFGHFSTETCRRVWNDEGKWRDVETNQIVWIDEKYQTSLPQINSTEYRYKQQINTERINNNDKQKAIEDNKKIYYTQWWDDIFQKSIYGNKVVETDLPVESSRFIVGGGVWMDENFFQVLIEEDKNYYIVNNNGIYEPPIKSNKYYGWNIFDVLIDFNKKEFIKKIETQKENHPDTVQIYCNELIKYCKNNNIPMDWDYIKSEVNKIGYDVSEV
jgi:hypothetical protein